MILVFHILYVCLNELLAMSGFGRGFGRARGRQNLVSIQVPPKPGTSEDNPPPPAILSSKTTSQVPKKACTLPAGEDSSESDGFFSDGSDDNDYGFSSKHKQPMNKGTSDSIPAIQTCHISQNTDQKLVMSRGVVNSSQEPTVGRGSSGRLTSSRGRGIVSVNVKPSYQPSVTNHNSSASTSGTASASSIPSSTSLDEFALMQQNNPDVSPAFLSKLHKRTTGQVVDVTKCQEEWAKPPKPAEYDQKWLKKLEDLWSSPRKSTVPAALGECFATSPNPYLTTLFLTSNASDFFKAKNSTLASTICIEFDRWCVKHEKKISHLLDKPTRMHAVKTALKTHLSSLQPLARAFQLNHPNNEYLMPFIKPLLSAYNYKEAAQLIGKLGLQDHYDTAEVLVPLLLQDKINVIEQYVYRRSKQQEQLLAILDKLCNKDVDLEAFLGPYKHVNGIQRDKLHTKILSKLAVRLMKLYQIPQEACPNINNARCLAALRYLMYRKYIDGTVEGGNWNDLITSSVGNNQCLQLQLVDQLVNYLDMSEAAKWARHYKLPQDSLPIQVQELMNEPDRMAEVGRVEDWDVQEDEGWDTPEPGSSIYHQLALPEDAIVIVTTTDAYYECMDYLSQCQQLGLDAEWRPSLGMETATRMALLQIACRDRVYLLDILSLTQILNVADWQVFGDKLIANDNILKIGFGLETDLQMLSKSVPSLQLALTHMASILDLLFVKEQLQRICPEALEPVGKFQPEPEKVVKATETGLSHLVRVCLGRPLDKTQQMSNWERRPLRRGQVVYAALDAFVLLELYDQLQHRVDTLKMDVRLASMAGSKSTRVSRTRMERRQAKVAERPSMDTNSVGQVQQQDKTVPQGDPITPAELSVVCDNMLQGLGRHLRCCGVDVFILDNNDDHDKAAEIARKENRIILTSGAPYFTLKSQVPEGRCLNVNTAKARDQAMDVLDHFNVKVTPRDIFSRCQVCNGNKYIHIKAEEMKEAWKRKKELVQKYGEKGLRMRTFPSKDSGSKESDPNTNWGKKSGQDHIDMESLTINNGVPLLVNNVPEPIFDKVDLFYCCAKCGKVFWEGTHFTRVCAQFSHVLTENKDDDKSPVTLYTDGRENFIRV